MRPACTSTLIATADGETEVDNADYLHGVLIEADGTNAVAVLLEDGTAELFTIHCIANQFTQAVLFPAPVRVNNALNVTVTGTNGQAAILTSR